MNKLLLFVVIMMILSTQAFGWVSDGIPWEPKPEEIPSSEYIQADFTPDPTVEEKANYLMYIFIIGAIIFIMSMIIIFVKLRKKKPTINEQDYKIISEKYNR